MVHKERIGRSHTREFRGKFARLQTKPSLALYYVHTGVIYWGEVKTHTQVRTQVNTIGKGQVNVLS